MNQENKNQQSAQDESAKQQQQQQQQADSQKTQNQSPAQKQEKSDSKPAAPQIEQSVWKKFMAKKWASPAMYMAAAVIILGLMWAYQGSSTNQSNLTDGELGLVTSDDPLLDFGQDDPQHDAMPVTGPTEEMSWPVANFSDLMVVRPYFDQNDTVEARQAAVIEYKDTYMPSTGVSLAQAEGETFDVMAALSGKVTRVEENAPLVGSLVEITHHDGLKTVYSSLSDVDVQLNEEVERGQIIASAGRNELEKEIGIHVHFEVLQDGAPINPSLMIATSSKEQVIAEDETEKDDRAKDETEEDEATEGEATEGEVESEERNAESDREPADQE